MYGVERQDGPVATLVLRDEAARSAVVLAPERGGMAIGFEVRGRQLLYLDRRTLEDRAANVRGGIPVLFPSPGKLTADAWAWGGASGSIKQHGFARLLPWSVVATGTDDGAWATLSLASSDASRAQFPFDFAAAFTYRLRAETLAIEIAITNAGNAPMPFGLGFHPYFAVPDADKPAVRIPSRATRAFDNRHKREVPFKGFDLGADEVDLHLHDHGGSEASLHTPVYDLALRATPELMRWVVWALRGRDFVCVEPWSCPADALNSGKGLLVLRPGERREARFEIACLRG